MSQAFLASAESDGEEPVDIHPSDVHPADANTAGFHPGGTGKAEEDAGGRGDNEDVFSVSVAGQSRAPSVKPAVLEGDYQPKDLAQAIQTLLKRDET
jgi:hypothetical protein